MYRQPSLSYSFAGKRVLVTGGAQGIGEALVRKFYNDGAIVFVLDKEKLLLEKLKSELQEIRPVCVDLLNWEKTQEAISALVPIDHLVNNAGVFRGESLLTMNAEMIDEILGVNVKGTICATQAVVNGNIRAGKERGTTIVHISSFMDRIGMWGGGCYCASKAAITSLTKTMALEFAHLNIRVNSVCPTFVPTTMTKNISPEIIEKSAGKVAWKTLLKEKPLEGSDIADAVLFLSSPLSQMMTGTSLLVDAGRRAS